jgi:uncharacterized protein YyaL (SSP411 family)
MRWQTAFWQRGAALLVGQLFLAPAASALVNQLGGHASPYLALHANDPVTWQDWDQDAVTQARRDGKLLYISIGYFSCRWCHVMQRESYRDREVAQFLNRHFVPVKIDRELEPALDARMSAFAESLQGISGWPLNVFVTPQGHPLYAVLYLPPQEFLAVLQRLQYMWARERRRLQTLAAQAAAGGRGPGPPRLNSVRVSDYVARAEAAALALGDPFNGGFGEVSKFPSVPLLQFLLDRWQHTHSPDIKAFLLLTLDQMAALGLHDHLAGGFFRYTVDPGWTTPHFEKMLYDNALLAQLYLRASRVFARPDYETVARRTFDFMVRELFAGDGALIASLSSVDNNGIEGGYYLWRAEELRRLLQPLEREAYALAWGMSGPAPFDAGYLPIKSMPVADVAKTLQRSEAETVALLKRASRKLRHARSQRRLPRDTKVLAAWNGLALSAFAYAARVTGEAQYRQSAQALRGYLAQRLWGKSGLARAFANGQAVGKPGLEDYAYVAQGLFAWAKLTGLQADYELPSQIVQAAWGRFYGPQGWRRAESSLIVAETGQDVILDGPMPSPSGVLAQVSLELASATGHAALRERALAALNSGHRELAENPLWNATPLRAMLSYLGMRSFATGQHADGGRSPAGLMIH